jgi:hypothetical protein
MSPSIPSALRRCRECSRTNSRSVFIVFAQASYASNQSTVFDLRSARSPPFPALCPSLITHVSAGPMTWLGEPANPSKDCDGHPGRVLSLSFLGSLHAPAILSTTSAGYCGVWSADSLADPAISCIPLTPSCDRKGVHHPPASAASFVSGTGSSSASASVECIVGRVDGALLIHSRGSTLNCERVANSNLSGGQGHSAPITCIATPSSGGVIFSDLAITCSMDWSLKLWSLKVCR